ncbi:MAG: AsmA-like C-terminal domain-containing protein [Pseudomonadota bacterium]
MAQSPFAAKHRPSPGMLGRCGQGLRICLRLLTAGTLLALMAVGLLYLRLQQGPLPLPGLSELIAERVNARITGSEIAVGGAELSLAGRGAPAGLRFTDVEVRTPDGTMLMAAPRLAARFDLSDLALGRIQPTRILLIGAQARVVRGRDGRFRFGLGTGPGVAVGEPGSDGAGADAVADIIRSFVGDTPPIPVLEKLREVGILRTELTYADARTGRSWRTRGTDLQIFRTGDGARAVMRASISDREGPGADRTRLAVRASRKTGTFRTDFTIRLAGLRPADLADQVEALSWMEAFDAPLNGVLRLSVLRGGVFGPLSGALTAEAGAIRLGEEETRPFSRLHLAFEAAEGPGALDVSKLEIAAPGLDLSLSGRTTVASGDPMNPGLIGVSLAIDELRLTEPTLFAQPIRFTQGQLIGQITPDPLRIDIAEALLVRDALALSVRGQITETEAGLQADLRTTGRDLTVADLKSHWPIPAAANARTWVVENLVSGRIPELLGQFRFGQGEPLVSLDFRFEDLISGYLGAMSPITDAAGMGHLAYNDFLLMLDRGQVAPGGARPIQLAGSDVRITDLWEDVTWGDITIRADGPLASVLGLIDEPPLGLVGKLGFDPASASGQSRVRAKVRLPLEADLKIEEVAVSADADLAEVQLTLPLAGSPTEIAAERLSLRADTQAMRIAGDVVADGAPLSVDWQEVYGAGTGSRRLSLSGELTPEVFATRGIDLPLFAGGRAPVTVEVDGDATGTAFSADIDLRPAALDAQVVRWSKGADTPGRLRLSGRVGDATVLDRITLDAPGLELSGRAAFGPEGDISSATIDRLRLGDRAELTADVERAPDGAIDIRVAAPLLDLSEFVTEPTTSETGGGPPLRLSAEVDRLILTPKLRIEPATGFLIRTSEGSTKLELEGRVGATAPFATTYSRRSGEPAQISVRSNDAGGLLGATGLFSGGGGGVLSLEAQLDPQPGVDASGLARITDMTVRSDGTFGSILEEGGVSEAAEVVQDEGLAFDSIEIPFKYADSVMSLGSSIARSPMLAIKVEGVVDEASDRVALAGVISPAYALTGALDEIPVLGALLSGGRGEGILAMTFQVNGTLDDPNFSVNPLSILTPGFLRRVFGGSAEAPADGFLNQLGPTE